MFKNRFANLKHERRLQKLRPNQKDAVEAGTDGEINELSEIK